MKLQQQALINTNTDRLDSKGVCSYGVILASKTVTSIFSRERRATHASATRLNVNIIDGVPYSGMSVSLSLKRSVCCSSIKASEIISTFKGLSCFVFSCCFVFSSCLLNWMCTFFLLKYRTEPFRWDKNLGFQVRLCVFSVLMALIDPKEQELLVSFTKSLDLIYWAVGLLKTSRNGKKPQITQTVQTKFKLFLLILKRNRHPTQSVISAGRKGISRYSLHLLLVPQREAASAPLP